MTARLLILLIAAAAASAASKPWPPLIPWEEAPFKEAEQETPIPFEERTYPRGLKWVCTSRVLPRRADLTPNSTGQMLYNLLTYFGGHNSSRKKMTPAFPYLVSLTAASGSLEKVEQRMCLFLGKKNQDNPPVPSDHKVFVLTTSQLNIVTRRLEGFFSPTSWQLETVDMMDLAAVNDVNVNGSVVHYASFMPPHAFLYQRNEVWLEVVGHGTLQDGEAGINLREIARENLGMEQ